MFLNMSHSWRYIIILLLHDLLWAWNILIVVCLLTDWTKLVKWAAFPARIWVFLNAAALDLNVVQCSPWAVAEGCLFHFRLPSDNRWAGYHDKAATNFLNFKHEVRFQIQKIVLWDKKCMYETSVCMKQAYVWGWGFQKEISKLYIFSCDKLVNQSDKHSVFVFVFRFFSLFSLFVLLSFLTVSPYVFLLPVMILFPAFCGCFGFLSRSLYYREFSTIPPLPAVEQAKERILVFLSKVGTRSAIIHC